MFKPRQLAMGWVDEKTSVTTPPADSTELGQCLSCRLVWGENRASVLCPSCRSRASTRNFIILPLQWQTSCTFSQLLAVGLFCLSGFCGSGFVATQLSQWLLDHRFGVKRPRLSWRPQYMLFLLAGTLYVAAIDFVTVWGQVLSHVYPACRRHCLLWIDTLNSHHFWSLNYWLSLLIDSDWYSLPSIFSRIYFSL